LVFSKRKLEVKPISKVLEREFVLEKPKDKNLAHYATPLFSLAKELRKSPAMIASEFADKFGDNKIVEASAVSGYLNFKLKSEFLDEISKQIFVYEFITFEDVQKICESDGVEQEGVSAQEQDLQKLEKDSESSEEKPQDGTLNFD